MLRTWIGVIGVVGITVVPPPGQAEWQPLFDGKTLANWQPTKFGGEGAVRVQDGQIVLEMGVADLTGITWTGPQLPTSNYELALQAMRVDGNDFFAGITFPVADSFCSLILGGWGGTAVGISSINGEDASQNETSQTISFEDRRWYDVRIRVTPEKIQAWVDERQIIDLEIGRKRLTTRSEVDLSQPLGVAAWRTKSALRNIRLRRLASTQLAAPRDSIDLLVDASKTGAKIDRHIFGQFAEHLGHGVYEGIWVGPGSPIPNTRGIRNDVVAALKALKVPNVRWPGGCFADEYHWRNGVGPANRRAVTLNPNWGGVTEPNTFGTHEFMDFLDQIGSEAYLSINVGSGTPQEAADWLEYLTTAQPTTLAKERAANGRAAPYKIAFLGIGNESWDCGGNMTPEYYLRQLTIYSRFVRNFNPAQRDASRMLKIAVGPGGDGPRWTEWTDTIMKAWRARQWSWDMDGLSLHNYTVVRWPPAFASVGFGEREYAEILKSTLEMDRLIATHSAIMDKYDPEKRIALAVDEWGAWYAPLAGSNPGFLVQQNSLRDTVLAALNLNIFARHADRVRIANIAQMINVLQAMIVTEKEKMVLTPTYHVFRMYVPFQDAAFVPVTFAAGTYTNGDITLPRVDAIAAKDAAGTLWLSLTNVDPARPVDIAARLTGISATTASGDTLTAAAVDSVNTFAAPQTVTPKPVSAKVQGNRLTITLAPKSVTVIAVRP